MFILIVVLLVLIFIFYIIHKMATANAGDRIALAKANDKVNEAEIAKLKTRINYLNRILVSIIVSPESTMKLKYVREPIVNQIAENDNAYHNTSEINDKGHLDDSIMDSLKKL